LTTTAQQPPNLGDKRQDVVGMALFKSLWLQIFSRAAWHEETFTAAV